MSVLDPEYTGKVVDSAAEFEQEVARKKRQKEQQSSSSSLYTEETQKELDKQVAKKQLTKGEENAQRLKITDDNKGNNSNSNQSAKSTLEAINTSTQGMDAGAPPPSPFGSALQAGITSGGNPAAIGGAFLMGIVQSAQHKEKERLMGQARAKMEEAKGEKAKGDIALKMGESVSRAIGGAGRKRSINI